ncbi:MAG: molybdopterin-dependent oxidoreductase, partial [Dongiaceae bacterium]
MSERAPPTVLRTSCPRDCYDGCGIAVIKRGERIVKVLGDPQHPVSRGALCGKCAIAYNGAWRDPALRLSQPLRRRGAKGEASFEPVGWDEALGEIADRLHGLLADPGPAALWHAHYTGTCSLIAGSFPLRFFNRLGAGEVEPDSICNLAGQVALDYLYGTALEGFDPRSAAEASCLLLWGINPSASAPHAHKHWIRETPAKLVVVDPVATPTARAADLHLQPFPGTDAVLAFALLHVLEREGLTDRDFISRHVLGWAEIAADIAATTPERAAAVTGVPAAAIVAAARLYGGGPALLWLGQGLQRQPLGGNAMRACALLPAATGNLGRRGGGFCYLNGSGRKGIDQDYLAAPRLRREPPRKLSHMDLADALGDPARMRALFCWNINIAASNPQQERLRRGLARDDLLLVVADLFMTDTARFADFVLPAASFLEFDDMTSPYFHLSVGAQVKATEPPGEALPNQEIFRRLARAMGHDEPELLESDAAMLDALARQAGIAGGFAGARRRRLRHDLGRAGRAVRRPPLPDAERQGRDRLGPRRRRRPAAHPAAARRSPAGAGPAAAAVAGLALADEQQLRQRPADRCAGRTAGDPAASRGRGRPRPRRGRARHGRQRYGLAGAAGALRPVAAARRRAVGQGRLAAGAARRPQRQLAQSRPQGGHGRELGGARRRGDGDTGPGPGGGRDRHGSRRTARVESRRRGGPVLPGERLERRLAAILAADVAGYSRLMGADEEGTLSRLKTARQQLLDPQIDAHHGRLVKTTGDGLLVEFASVVDALRCAVAIQQGMAGLNAGLAPDRAIVLRIGINVGDVIVEAGDLYGDGVNVAARLEALAEPGGICVSARVQEDARGKLDLAFEDLGEQALKNIAWPVRVYRLRPGEAPKAPPPALALPDRPSIAVLPFQNMSGDPGQDYFADGIVEDIITALSRMRWLFVIARNSSFAYKGRSVDVRQVGRELGVRYILEGSVRKAGNRVRITGQLIEAASGAHLWADHFDGELEDIFDLQDRVTGSVVGAIQPRLEQAEIERVRRKPTESLDAYDYCLRGMAAFHRWTREANEEALAMFYKAIELDPGYAVAYAMAARAYSQRRSSDWVTDRARETAETLRLGRRAVELGRDDAFALCSAGAALVFVAGDFEGGGASIERALALNPNLAWAWLSGALLRAFSGESEAAIDHATRALRLSPHDTQVFAMQFAVGLAHFFAGRPAEALSWAE